ncbi:GNAT family N-acetyltransferase [Streptacidiphilus sp. PB12-B1b]|uniref:GNAT family N-acetyltransferase n=1 Tax=Streptacidiphilus sp. PB12-B1b TaxID=2705012 RepID=UPI0015FD5B7C|nr:GNAT family N-acetyltransferase [Streptacidiphilus sp. PB12-B1b]QMU76372.1 GNAT family N-acetyltransferase [Streptacidiphilus sp. PB12-B1b]
MGMSVTTSIATEDDAERILKLQYLCYQSEAELYGDWAIEPLTQTLDSLRTELKERHVLVARLGDEVVGSVRGWADSDGVGRIGRLCVHPRMQRHGLGSRLVRGMEQRLAEGEQPVHAYRLFTGHLSHGNLRLYERLGYRRTQIEEVNTRLSFIGLEKPVQALAATA